MAGPITYREGLTAGAFGAAALLMPFVFHVLQLGHVFMPMYLPLLALAFYVRPAPAAAAALLVPLLSSVLTGMPPLYPPVAPIMSVELACMAGGIALARRRWPDARALLLLAPALLAGRALQAGLVYLTSLAMDLPAMFLAGASLLSGWPGVLLMLVVIPVLLHTRPPAVDGHSNGSRHLHPHPGGTFAGEAGDPGGENTDVPPAHPAVIDPAHGNPRVQYFDAIAPEWESRVDTARIASRLSEALDVLGIRGNEHILDLGCGTGILSGLLLSRLSERGRVTAVDFSRAMLHQARRKIGDGRVSWIAADATSIPLANGSVDRAIAFSTWPHFPDPEAVLREMHRLLRPCGSLHVLHVDSRQRIIAIHSGAGGAIGGDLLVPARDLAAAMERSGFRVTSTTDDDEAYRVDAARVSKR